MAHPATPRDPYRPPLPSVQEIAAMQPRNFFVQSRPDQPGLTPMPRLVVPLGMEGYALGPAGPKPTATGGMVRANDLIDRLQAVQVEAQRKLAEAGQGKYIPFSEISSLGDVTYNIGQLQPFGQQWVGKALTGLGQTGVIATHLLSEPALQIEKTQLGHALWQSVALPEGGPGGGDMFSVAYARSKGEPIPEHYANITDLGQAYVKARDEYSKFVAEQGIMGDPVKEQAFNAAMAVSYSGFENVQSAYQDAITLSNAGRLTPENKALLEAKHGNWVQEIMGRTVLDPLMWGDVISGGTAKGIRYIKQVRGARLMFEAPLLTSADEVVKTSKITEIMVNSATRKGQAAAGENLIEKGLAWVWPRYKASVIHRLDERTSQVVGVMAGVTNQRAAATMIRKAERLGIKPGTDQWEQFFTQAAPEITRQAADDFQKVAMMWAATADEDVKIATKSAKQLEQAGYGTVPQSLMGRQTGVVLRQVMQKADGEMGDLLSILDVAVKEGLPVEEVLEKWSLKVSKVLDNMIPKAKWETGPIQKAVENFPLFGTKQPVRRGVDKAFGALFMGLNPGYAMRNFYDNTGKMLLTGYSPLSFAPDPASFIGVGVVGAKRGIGQAGEAGSLPVHKIASWTESKQSQAVANQAYKDMLNRLESPAIKQLQNLPDNLKKLVKGFLHRDISYIDRLAEAEHNLNAWQMLDNEALVDAIQVADPHLYTQVLSTLDSATTPEEAVAAIRKMQQQYTAHAVKVGTITKPSGPLAGTLSGHAADLMSNSGKTFHNLDELAQQLSGVEHNISHSHALAVDAIVNSADPARWGALMDDAERAYAEAVQHITQRQLLGYARLLAGEIDEVTYSNHLLNIYHKEYNKLDSVYSFIINGAGRAVEGEIPQQKAVQWVLQREAMAANPQYPGAVIRGQFPGDEVFHPVYTSGHAVPDAHFGNKIRAIMRDLGIDEQRVSAITKLEDLTPEEAVQVINHFRSTSGKAPLTIDQVVETAQKTVSPATYGKAPTAPPPMPKGGDVQAILDDLMEQRDALFEHIDELKSSGGSADDINKLQNTADALDDQVDNLVSIREEQNLAEYLARTDNPQAHIVAQAAKETIEMAPAPTPIAATNTTVERAVSALDWVVDDVMNKAVQPPLAKAPLISEELATQLRGLYTQAHTVASEVARRSRDFTLLDYSDRRSIDGVLKFVFPWHYWYSRSIPNWASTVVTRPIMTAKYMEFQRLLKQHNAQDPNVPEWAKDSISLRPPGYHGTMFWNFDAAFNAIGNIYNTFEDPDRQKDALGQLLQKLSIAGPAVHPLLIMAYAAERGIIGGDKDALRSYGYLSGQTRLFANFTGKTVEPWLWLDNPQTGEKIPWSGGSKWDIEKAVRKMGYEQGQGQYDQEQAVLSAATHSGAPLMNTLTTSIAEYRRMPLLLSFLGGLQVNVRQPWEQEIADLNQQYWDLSKTNPQQAKQLLVEKPWLATVWMSWDNDAARMRMLANNVLARIPPLPGQERNQLLESAGLSPELMDMFYSGRENKESMADWDKEDYDQFNKAIMSLAVTFSVPDTETAKAWQRAKTARSDMEQRLQEKFPDAHEQEQIYFKLKETDEDAAGEYAQQSGLYDYWNAEMHEMLKNPVLMKYYAGPAKVDTFTNSLMYEQLRQNFGADIMDLRAAYGQIPDDDTIAKRQFRYQHPQVMQSYSAQNDILRQIRHELRYLRQYAGTGELPELYEDIIKPTARQKAVLNRLSDLEFDRSVPVPQPPMPSEKFTPQERARMQAYDNAVAHTMRFDPDYLDKEREFNQMKELYGDDAAWAYADDSGLLDDWDVLRIAKAHQDATLVEMDDQDVLSAAKALMREEAERRWPGLNDWMDQYYQLPRSAKGDRRKARDEYPAYKEYLDWKEGAIQNKYEELRQRREQLRQQGVQMMPQSQERPVAPPSQVSVSGQTPIQKVADAIAQVESGNNYTAKNKNSSASGRYQYVDNTWGNYGGYASAKDAPPEVQDERMQKDLEARAKAYQNDVEKMIAAHYYPKWANDKNLWDQRPTPDQITIREYVNKVLAALKKGDNDVT